MNQPSYTIGAHVRALRLSVGATERELIELTDLDIVGIESGIIHPDPHQCSEIRTVLINSPLRRSSGKKIVLVTGSRSLGLDPTTHGWITGFLHEAFTRFKPDLLVTGDAKNRRTEDMTPDQLAEIAAARLHGGAYVYCAQSGDIEHRSVDNPSVAGAWINPADLRALDPKARPLARNAKMVRDVATRDPEAIVLAFLDPNSKTRGTWHTACLAALHGLKVAVALQGDGS